MRTKAGDHVIYDQYLGQLFSNLTHIEMSKVPAQVVDAYLFKLYAQRLLVAGRSREAATFALASNSMTTEDDHAQALPEAEDQYRVRNLMTHVQEAFAIAHELMHLVLYDEVTYDELRTVFDDIVERAKSDRGDAEKARTHDGRMSLFNRQYMDDVKEVYRRRGIDAAGLTEPDDPDSYFANVDDIDLPALFDRPDVRLEAMCDIFAATSVADVLGDIGLTPVDVMATTTLALQHLRLVQLLDNVVSGQESPGELDDYCLQSIARVTLLRTGLGIALQVSLERVELITEENLTEVMRELHHAASRLNRLHTGVILDNLLLGLDLPRLGAAMRADPSVAAAIERLSSNTRLLRSMLGFPRKQD